MRSSKELSAKTAMIQVIERLLLGALQQRTVVLSFISFASLVEYHILNT
jgi:hypothetical protein